MDDFGEIPGNCLPEPCQFAMVPRHRRMLREPLLPAKSCCAQLRDQRLPDDGSPIQALEDLGNIGLGSTFRSLSYAIDRWPAIRFDKL